MEEVQTELQSALALLEGKHAEMVGHITTVESVLRDLGFEVPPDTTKKKVTKKAAARKKAPAKKRAAPQKTATDDSPEGSSPATVDDCIVWVLGEVDGFMTSIQTRAAIKAAFKLEFSGGERRKAFERLVRAGRVTSNGEKTKSRAYQLVRS